MKDQQIKNPLGQEGTDLPISKCEQESEVFNQNAMTAASNSHKMGTKLKVTNVATGKSVIVKINDTGAFTRKYGRTLDLSQSAFARIAPLSQGICKVKIERL